MVLEEDVIRKGVEGCSLRDGVELKGKEEDVSENR